MTQETELGYSPFGLGIPAGAVESTRVGTVQAKRMSEPFHVRGPNHVDYIKDGWLCQDEQGNYFGVEDAVIDKVLYVPPPLWVDQVTALTAGQVGVAYSFTGLGAPSYSGVAASTNTLSFGVAPGGLTIDTSNVDSLSITGTPTTAGAYYLEFTYVYENRRSVRVRYSIFIAAA